MVRQGHHGALCHDFTAAAAVVFAGKTLSQNGIVYDSMKEIGGANLAQGSHREGSILRGTSAPFTYAYRCLVCRSDMFKSSSQSLTVEVCKQIDNLNCNIGNQSACCGCHASVQIAQSVVSFNF